MLQRARTWLTSLALVVPLAACTAASDDPATPDAGDDVAPDAPSPDVVAGKHVHTLTVDGLAREVIVYVPASAVAPSAAPAPAVMMLHGTSGDGERFYQISGWREQADATGLIAVFPTALTHCLHEDENLDGDFDDAGERKVTTKWASGQLGGAEMPLCSADELATLSAATRALADHPLADDLAYVDAILDLLETEYPVDTSRLYATGFSNGGQMASRLAAERSEQFAAIAAAAGFLAFDPPPAARPLSMVASVGSRDDRFTTLLGIEEIPISATLLTDFPAFAAGISDLRALLGLGDAYTYEEEVLSGKLVGTFTFADSLAGAGNTLTFAVIDDAFHVYPNGDNHPVVMANPLWAFFADEALAP